jgi:hypothetical protein
MKEYQKENSINVIDLSSEVNDEIEHLKPLNNIMTATLPPMMEIFISSDTEDNLSMTPTQVETDTEVIDLSNTTQISSLLSTKSTFMLLPHQESYLSCLDETCSTNGPRIQSGSFTSTMNAESKMLLRPQISEAIIAGSMKRSITIATTTPSLSETAVATLPHHGVLKKRSKSFNKLKKMVFLKDRSLKFPIIY